MKASHAHSREFLGVICAALGLTLLLSIWTFDPADGVRIARGLAPSANLIGLLGYRGAEFLLSTLGVGALLLALCLLGIAAMIFSRLRLRITALEALGWLAVVFSGAMLAHLLVPEARPFHHTPGGLLGLLGGEVLRDRLNTVGAVIVCVAFALLALVLASDLRLVGLAALARKVFDLFRPVIRVSREAGRRLWSHHLQIRAERRALRARRLSERGSVAPPAAEASSEVVVSLPRTDASVEASTPGSTVPTAAAPSKAASIAPSDERVREPDPLGDPNNADPAWAGTLVEPRATALPAPELHLRTPGPLIEGLTPSGPLAPLSPEAIEQLRNAPSGETNDPEPVDATALPVQTARAPAPPEQKSTRPTIVEAQQPQGLKKRRKKTKGAFAFTTHGGCFDLPPLDLLDPTVESKKATLDENALHETARKLCQKLADFGISGEVTRIRLGPVVTMYEFVPGPGVKISKIAGLSDDLAMAMEALRVRIVAPLPGKGAVGIEVPNKVRQMVHLREILEQPIFLEAKGKLTLGMGKDVEGMPFVADLAKMPHLLVAGTTGSGKSVSVNAMISSILFRATPDEVRFIMVDPKWTELSLYEGIPHLLLPVVKDPTKAALALRWAVEEMDRRYQLLADHGVRGLTGFNLEALRLQKAWTARQAALPPLPDLETMSPDDPSRPRVEEETKQRLAGDPRPPDTLPLIVIIIDELADLMMVASREVETYIARIAQKARAAGIHLLVATQRPSTDVLTGLIKVNFPARIGFRVASRHDSQTIINQPGSEKLLGMGDMLIIPPGQSDPTRVHGAFVSDDEVKRLVDHLKGQGQPIYDESILKARDDDRDEEGGEEEYDARWDEAVMVVSERENISVSMLQRRMKIGYNRAARMIERMEREGIVGPADGAKPRDVLISAPPPTTPPPTI